jgi:hypothetical protein
MTSDGEMMKTNALAGLVIRTAVVRRPDIGYIYAADPQKEKEEIPHAFSFKWSAGAFTRGELNYDAHSACLVDKPDTGLVSLAGAGYYSLVTAKGNTTGDIVDSSRPPSKETRIGGFRAVSDIGGQAYAVGLRGMVYRLDAAKLWTRIDDGLANTFEGQAIHGFEATDVYAAGRDGQLWHFDGVKWLQRELPTNVNLTSVKCAGDGKVYVAGHGGMLISGRDDQWEVVAEEAIEEDIWDLEWFDNRLYISTMRAVYQLNKDGPERVDFGADAPKSCYQLSAAKDVMWSNGEFDIMSFDGMKWSRVV